jgi:acyl-CoA thioesterase-1
MKKIILIVILCVAAWVGYVFFLRPEPKITNYPSSGINIIAFGDSLVEGVGATDGNNFVSKLSAKIGVPIINKGVSGNTTRQGLARIDDVLDNDPKVVIVLLGGNDAIQKIPTEETFRNLEVIIQKIQAKGAIVLLLGVQGRLLSDPFKGEFEKLAAKYHTAYVPNVLDGLIGNLKYMSDSVHPNDLGYEIIAEKIKPVLSKLLR